MLKKFTANVEHLTIKAAFSTGALRKKTETASHIIKAAEHSMVSISLREPDLSKCRVSNIVKADIRLNKAPHISIEKYIVWMLSIHFTPSA